MTLVIYIITFKIPEMPTKIEAVCLFTIVGLTIVSSFINVPLQINIVGFSLSIIIAGSYRSVEELLKEFKKVHVDKLE